MPKYPEHTDERAYKFFKHGFDGKPGGSYYFDTSSSEAIETDHIDIDGRTKCAYCGVSMQPLQLGLADYKYDDFSAPSEAYKTTGYTCTCSGAMDEYDYHNLVKEENKRHAAAIKALKKPKHNVKVIKQLQIESLKRQITKLQKEF